MNRNLLMLVVVSLLVVTGPGWTLDADELAVIRQDAEDGVATAQVLLGSLYSIGEGVPESPQEALKWFSKAAEQGSVEAQLALGAMYVNGDGVATDTAAAKKWLTKAAEQGHSQAQLRLAVMFYEGEGIAQDFVQAHQWFLRAADQGEGQAQALLAIIYTEGQGVPADPLAAYVWASLSAASPQATAPPDLLKKLAARLTPAQLEEARQRCLAWQAGFKARHPSPAGEPGNDQPAGSVSGHTTPTMEGMDPRPDGAPPADPSPEHGN